MTWPAAPDFDQLEHGAELRAALAAAEADFETDWAPTGLPGQVDVTITRGADGGFTDIILAAPISTIDPMCSEIIAARPAWARAVATARSIPTIAVELRSKRSSVELGAIKGSLVTAYEQPLATWADMSFLLSTPSPIRHLSYLCGPWPVSAPLQGESERASVKRRYAEASLFVDRWLRCHGPHLFPAAVKNGELDLDLFEPAVVRLNLNASELYVLSPPGSIDERLYPTNTGIANLYVAGDWTRSGIDAGCYEAALVSGLDAANALRAAAAADTK